MIRVGFLWVLFLASLFTVIKAPAYYLWILSILVSELPWIFIVITLFLLAWGIGVNKYQWQGAIPGILALILFCSPIVRAYIVNRTVRQNFEAAFGQGTTNIHGPELKKPFRFFKMLAGIGEKPVPHKVLTYDPQYNLNLDYYSSVATTKSPCVVVVHGGSWSSGNSSELPEINSILAKNGYNVASINYRLAPKYKYTAPVEDIHTTFNYLKSHAAELNIDTDKFVLMGRSAGGQIALLAAYTLQEPGLKAVVSYYAPADMVWGYSIPSNPLIMDSRKVMGDYLGGSYSEVPNNFAASSPLLAVNKKSVPTLLIHGENDVLVAYEHSRRLNAKLEQLGVKHFLLTLPWATHGCDYAINGPSGQLATYTVERFLYLMTH